MSHANDVRLRGNPVKAFGILRRQPPPLRNLPAGKLLVPKPGPHVLDVLGKRMSYKSEPDYHRALRAAACEDREEITSGGEGR